MTTRVNDAHRLAGILSKATGYFVILAYQRKARTYAVIWTGGPDEAAMWKIAQRHAFKVAHLEIASLLWERREPVKGGR